MYKSLSILLISMLICGMICIESKENNGLRRGRGDQVIKTVEENNSQDAEQSSFVVKRPKQEENSKATHNIETTQENDFKLMSLRKMKKSPLVMNKHRLLSDNNNSQQHQNDNDNEMNQANERNSSCSTQRCQTCVNSTCTECKLDSNGQQKYLLINGRCHQADNQTDDHSSDNDHKWQDHEHHNEEGHVSYGGKKYKCDVGCKNCSTTTNFTYCQSCVDGFVLNLTLKCMKCDDKCVTCSQDNLSNCISCYPGWTIDGPDSNGASTCTKCTDAHCGACYPVSVCTTCKNFYYLSQSGVCQSCLPNCRICNSSSYCNQCFSGYFVYQLENGTQSCNLCVSGCANCSDLTTCLNCYPGYFMNTNTKTCEKCSQNCWSCNSSSTCLRCVMGTKLVNNSCVYVIEDCAVMNNDSTCGQCYQGYQLSDSGRKCSEISGSSESYNRTYTCGQNQYVQNHTCMNCTISVDNCQKCNDTSCRKCKPQYFLTNNGLSCTLCSNTITGCKNCHNPIFCQKCADGYYMEQDKNGSDFIISYGNCIACDSNCQTCNQNSIYCTSCSNGYLLTTARTCIPPNQFNFTLLLNLDLNQFPSKISQFKRDLVNLISDSDLTSSQKSNFVQITSIESGSIRVQGTMSATSSGALENTLTNFNTALSSGSMFSGIGVISSKTQQKDSSTLPTDSSTTSNTGVIIGVVVGVVCAIIIITVIVIYCCCCKKPVEQTQDVNLDEKRSSSTFDNFPATNLNQNTEAHNINDFAISNPPAAGPQYFA